MPKVEMYRNYPLAAGQMYANITVDYKRSFYLIVVTTMVTVSADVIQFNPSEAQKDQHVFSDQMGGPMAIPMAGKIENSMSDYLEIGKDVGILTMGKLKSMTLTNQLGKKRYELVTSDSSTYIFDNKSIYLIDEVGYDFQHGFSVGDQVQWLLRGETKTGMIVGVNEKMVVIKNEDQLIEIWPIDIEPIQTETE